MRPATSSLILFALAPLLCATAVSFAQGSKAVREPCEADADCKSGHCVTLRDGRTKKCSDCDQRELEGYTAKVDEACKNKQGGELAFSDVRNEFKDDTERDVNYNELNDRLTACRSCLAARETREETCWDGGDDGHKKPMNDMREAISYLDGVMQVKKGRKLAYYCTQDTYEDAIEDIEDNCADIDALFQKYVTDNPSELACSDLSSLVDKTIDCREAYDYLASNCFKDGFSEPVARRFEKVKQMEKTSKDTLDKRKSDNTCK